MGSFLNLAATLAPEARQLAWRGFRITKRKVRVLSLSLPDNLMFFWEKGCRLVQIPVESNEISHTSEHGQQILVRVRELLCSRRECVVEDYIHPTSMDLVNGGSPIRYLAKMVVEQREVKWGVAI